MNLENSVNLHGLIHSALFTLTALPGIGSLFCLKAVDAPASVNPGRNNLQEFQVLWGDRWAEA